MVEEGGVNYFVFIDFVVLVIVWGMQAVLAEQTHMAIERSSKKSIIIAQPID